MRSIKFLLFSLFSLVIITSCQREVDGTLPGESLNDSIYISKYVEMDTFLLSGYDTTLIISYTYDGQKRLTREVEQSLLLGQEYIRTFDYYFNGNDTLPFRSITRTDQGVFSYIDTTFYEYTNGLISKDSTVEYQVAPAVSFSASETIRYQVAGGNVFADFKLYRMPGNVAPSEHWSGTIVRTMQNGNIVRLIDTSTHGVTFTREYESEFTYDTKANPSNRLHPKTPLFNTYLYGQKNNLVRAVFKNPTGVVQEELQITYTYRPDGYPIYSATVDPSVPGEVLKGYYHYIN